MGEFGANLWFLLGAFFLTTLSGYPVAQKIKNNAPTSKMVLSFAFGFGVISISGIVGVIIGIDSFILQATVTCFLILVFLIIFFKKNSSEKLREIVEHLREDQIIYLFGSLVTLVLVYYFSQIIIWTAGDGTFHSSVIRLIVEGEKVPVRLIPGGDYTHYPKGFHFYVAFYLKFLKFDIIQAMKILPILVVVMVYFGIYALIQELNFPRNLAVFAFMTSFAFWKHFYPLIWMGYPQLTADFFIVTLILSMFLESQNGYPKLSIFILTILYFIHPRHFLYSVPVLIWILISKFHGLSFRSFFLSFFTSFGMLSLLLIVFGKIGSPHYPAYITKLATGVESLTGFMFIWNIGLLAIVGIYFSLQRRSPGDWLLLMIFFSWLFMAFLIDSSIFRIDIPDKRSYSKLFIPLSFFTASFLYRLTIPLKDKIKVYLVAVNTFLIFFLLITSAFINAPILGWVMTESDYIAMRSLEGKTGITINADPTGRWIYPITGLKVTNLRGITLLNDSELKQIINSPNSEETFRIMDGLKKRYGRVYIFISQRTLEKPGYFMFDLSYPKIHVEEFLKSQRYEVAYDERALILEYMDFDQERES
jgi:hypothetical protein